MLELTELQKKLRNLANEISENAGDAARQVAVVQNETDRSLAITGKRLEEIALEEADEMARHQDAMARLRDERDAAIKDHAAVLAEAAVKARSLALQLNGNREPTLIAAE